MKGYKHNTNRKPPGRISLFPTPYPGESFYSVLCRYHIRSGNVNDWHTSNQLFGYNSKLRHQPFLHLFILKWQNIGESRNLGWTLKKCFIKTPLTTFIQSMQFPANLNAYRMSLRDIRQRKLFPVGCTPGSLIHPVFSGIVLNAPQNR